MNNSRFLKGLILGILVGALGARMIPGMFDRGATHTTAGARSSPDPRSGSTLPNAVTPDYHGGRTAGPEDSGSRAGRVATGPESDLWRPGSTADDKPRNPYGQEAAGPTSGASKHSLGVGPDRSPRQAGYGHPSNGPLASRDEPVADASIPAIREVRIAEVIDGDTVRLPGGESVRVIGVDTPERAQPFYAEARDYLAKAVRGSPARLEACEAEGRDRYGRTLAFLEAAGEDVGQGLLRAGLARTLLVGPCAKARGVEYRRLEREAFRAGRGIWSLQKPRRIPHTEAGRYLGELMTVTGKVYRVHRGAKSLHLNFGPDFRTDFTGVIYLRDLDRLTAEGLKPALEYSGKAVEITGTLKEYNGPEILIDSTDQLALVQ